MKLKAEQLMEQAEQATGLSRWGDDLSFQVGLSQAIEAMQQVDHTASVTDLFHAQMIGLLSTRLRLAEDEHQFPEITSAAIERPVILVGPARSGTTILHDLMALDPTARAPLEWETANPWPAPTIETFHTDPRIAQTDAGLAAFLKAAPQLRSLHPWGATLPSDCLSIMALHFASAGFWATYSIDEFATWLATEPAQGVYQTHRRVLQQLQWKGPRGRWTLKEPTHQLNLEQLVATYPDACFVQTHREPARTIPSAANLVHTIQVLNKPDRDPRDTGRVAATLFGACLERSTAARAADPSLDARILDVAYADTVTDPVGQVRRIHEHFDLPFSEGHATRIQEHMSSNSEAGQGPSRFRVEDYGLDTTALLESFPEYRERFSHLLVEPTRV